MKWNLQPECKKGQLGLVHVDHGFGKERSFGIRQTKNCRDENEFFVGNKKLGIGKVRKIAVNLIPS